MEPGGPQGLRTEGKEDAREQGLESEGPRGERPSQDHGWDRLPRTGEKGLPGRGARGSQGSDLAGDRGEKILNNAPAPPSTLEGQQGKTGLSARPRPSVPRGSGAGLWEPQPSEPRDLLFEAPHALSLFFMTARRGPGRSEALPTLSLMLRHPRLLPSGRGTPVLFGECVARVGTEVPLCSPGTGKTRGQGTTRPVRREASSAGESRFSGKERRGGGEALPSLHEPLLRLGLMPGAGAAIRTGEGAGPAPGRRAWERR